MKSHTGPFFAGETITVSTSQPTVGTPTLTELAVDSVVAASGGFPATLSHTVPADGTYDVRWAVNGGGAAASWNVSCTAGPVATTTTTTTTAAWSTTTTTSGDTTTTAVSPTSGDATTVVPPPTTGSLATSGSSGNANTIAIALLALLGGVLALMIARRRTP